jgi:hypothetical protein
MSVHEKITVMNDRLKEVENKIKRIQNINPDNLNAMTS